MNQEMPIEEVAARFMAAMLSNPHFCPIRKPGQKLEDASACYAFDYAEAFVREYERRRKVEEVQNENG